MPIARLDHITLTAQTLEAGVAHVRQALGVEPQKGGEHPHMGTHNYLLKLGDALFLEIIATNPAAPAPNRPRWFALDTLTPGAKPRLAAWVAACDDIGAAVAAAAPVDLGNIEAMTRGTASWKITIPADGSLPMQGVAPSLIQWTVEAHPASKLEDRGCTLARLEGFHPQAGRIESMLGAIGFAGDFSVRATGPGEAPHLVAHIRTPAGLRIL
jgi:hypothetical protein